MHNYFDDESLSAGENVQVNNAKTLSSNFNEYNQARSILQLN